MVTPVKVLCLLGLLALAGCAETTGARQMSRTIRSHMPSGRYLEDPDPKVRPVLSVDGHQPRQVCMVWGGPNTQLEGAIGLFGPDGQYMDSVFVAGMNGIAFIHDERASDDPPHLIAVTVMDRYGPGDWRESVVVYAVHRDRLVEAGRFAGDAYQSSGGSYQRHVTLLLTEAESEPLERLAVVSRENFGQGGTALDTFEGKVYRLDPQADRLRKMTNKPNP